MQYANLSRSTICIVEFNNAQGFRLEIQEFQKENVHR